MPSQPAARNAFLEMTNFFAAAAAAAVRRRGDRSSCDGESGGGADTGGGGGTSSSGFGEVGDDRAAAANAAAAASAAANSFRGLLAITGPAFDTVFRSNNVLDDGNVSTGEGAADFGWGLCGGALNPSCIRLLPFPSRDVDCCWRSTTSADFCGERFVATVAAVPGALAFLVLVALKGFGFRAGEGWGCECGAAFVLALKVEVAASMAEAAAARTLEAAVKMDEGSATFAARVGVFASVFRKYAFTICLGGLGGALDIARLPLTNESISKVAAASPAFVACLRGVVAALTGVAGRGVGEREAADGCIAGGVVTAAVRV